MLEKEEIFSWTLRKKKETVHCFVLILVKIVPGQKQIQFPFQKIKTSSLVSNYRASDFAYEAGLAIWQLLLLGVQTHYESIFTSV